MVSVVPIDAPDFSGQYFFWEIANRMPSSQASYDEVGLVQCLLARTFCGLTIPDDVDGIWGPKTAAAVSQFDSMYGSGMMNRATLQDGAVDPISLSGTSFNKDGVTFTYKLALMQDVYVRLQSPSTDQTRPADYSHVVMSLADDLQIPAPLLFLLKLARGLAGQDPNAPSVGT